MAGLEFRGPFLLVFALGQQLGTLLQQAMADAPLPPNEFAVYSALRLMQPTTPTQLAGALGMKATTLSSVLVRMSQERPPAAAPQPRRRALGDPDAEPRRRPGHRSLLRRVRRRDRGFRRQLTVDESALLADLEAMSAALARASAELADQDQPGLAEAGG